MDPAVASKPKLLISAWSLHLGALLLNVIGMGTPYWVYEASVGSTIYAGLWQYCRQVLYTIIPCKDINEFPGMKWVKMVQALMILSVMCFGGGFICLTLKIWVLKDRKEILHAVLLSTFAGAFLTLVAISRAADMKERYLGDTYTLHFSFAFCILGMLLGSAACILLTVDRLKNKESWINS
ncbi:uncharacterized protein LOC125646415 [Ostrea edulis]|uniref:uncharacterized protein LOC125646415 n=1 Tax=Ostrea edulis TaxID=37623 RepID=UPI0020957120|nr:uncharacterized protein LOC125646415 [Ostrea edulis]XP_048728628.1 uncharacterized protein LOC125646415 [Ostrea edulis]XP_048728629.1 uncharacterized protein LOC125646415 [Ostrea edulis]XP_048728630.1 uncharacterized protein LOC125646415 [Ostrea edulis]